MTTRGFCFIVLAQAVLLQGSILNCPYSQKHLHQGNVGPHSINKRSASNVCGVNPSSCNSSAYRSYDGSCNNLDNPSWGSADNTYDRLILADYGDDESTPRLAESGKPLPSPRDVSAKIFPSSTLDDLIWTLIFMQYGQIIVHDMSSAASVSNNVSCCSTDRKLLTSTPDECYPIEVSSDDPVYSKYNITCLPFTRPLTDEDSGCRGNGKQVQQITSVSAFLDASIIYGDSDSVNEQLRLLVGGKLLTNFTNGQEMLPTSSNPGCFSFNGTNLPCYVTGDNRVNQNPDLTILHTMLAREHNRVADELLSLNPHWNDERVFQETRKIVIGEHQQISYYEWLPILLGSSNVYISKILYKTTGFVNDYNKNVNPAVYNEHATASSRYFHTLIQGQLKLMNEQRLTKSEDKLSNNFVSPHLLEKDSDSFDDLTRGMCTQPMDAADTCHTSEITSNWAKRPDSQEIGQDLKSIDIQRGRANGLASYNDYRELCGLGRASTFLGFLDYMSLSNVQKLEQLYNTPNDVDLIVGAALENHKLGALAGPTNVCILIKQFWKTRVADRFWYENSGSTGFSLPQLKQIRKATISKLICDNTNIKLMQPSGFTQISLVNPLVACDLLPSVDLSLWKEYSDSTTTATETESESDEGATDGF